MPAAALPIVGGAIGGILGGQPNSSGQSQNSFNRTYLAPESELGKQAREAQGSNFDIFGKQVNAGANTNDISQAAGSQRSLADLLQSYSQGGYQPTQQDVSQAGSLADQLLAPSFRQQGVDAARQAASMGRQANDPILQAKLRTAQAEQRNTFVAQQAQQMPLQRLGFASQLSDVRNNLASQAMSNRQAILGIGGSILGQQENMQLGAASHEGNYQGNEQSGGGFGGALKGGFSGFMGGGGLNLFGSGGGGSQDATQNYNKYGMGRM